MHHQTQRLTTLLGALDAYEWNDWLCLPDGVDNVGPSTPSIVVPELSEDEFEVSDEKGMTRFGKVIQIEDVRSVVTNASALSSDEALVALAYYIENDAFIELRP